jgi:hypothetical protein
MYAKFSYTDGRSSDGPCDTFAGTAGPVISSAKESLVKNEPDQQKSASSSHQDSHGSRPRPGDSRLCADRCVFGERIPQSSRNGQGLPCALPWSGEESGWIESARPALHGNSRPDACRDEPRASPLISPSGCRRHLRLLACFGRFSHKGTPSGLAHKTPLRRAYQVPSLPLPDRGLWRGPIIPRWKSRW